MSYHWFSVSRLVMSSPGSDNGETGPPQQFTRQNRFAFASNIKIIPEGGWGWVICVAAFVAQLIVMGIHNSFGILYTTLLEEYKKSKAETGMLIRFIVKSFAFCQKGRILCRHLVAVFLHIVLGCGGPGYVNQVTTK